MRESWKTLRKIHLITILMSLCGSGNCLLGAAWCTALFQKRTKGFAGIILSLIVVWLRTGMEAGVKYAGVLAVMAAFSILSEMLGIRQRRYLYASAGMFLMELPEILFRAYSWEDFGMAAGLAAAVGITAFFFERALEALLDGKYAYLSQQSDAMLSTAWLVGAVTYAVNSTFDLPLLVLAGGVCLLLLFMGYTFGAAMGGTAGAAAGLVLSVSCKSIEYLGVLCFLGLLAGLFKELGRIGGTAAFLAGAAGLIFCGVSFLTQLSWLLGIPIACMLWVSYDIFLLLWKKGKKEEASPGVEEDNRDKDRVQRVAETLNQIASQCLEETVTGYEPDDDQLQGLQERVEQEIRGDQGISRETCVDVVRLNRLWKTKCMESRETVALQLKETAKLIEQLCRPESVWTSLAQAEEETLRRQFSNLRVEAGSMRKKQHGDGRLELEVTLRMKNAADKQNLCVMAKEILPVFTELFGKEFQFSSDNKTLIGKEYGTYRLLESPIFHMIHGSAMAKKGTEDTSGDTFGITATEEGNVVFGLADGPGTGVSARRGSNLTLERLEQLLTSGMTEEMSIQIINTLMLSTEAEEQGSSLDFGVLNLNSGVCHLVKAGGAATFIRRSQWVEMIRSRTLPVGMLPGEHFDRSVRKLYDGDMIFLVSDGFVQAFPGREKEMEISRFLMEEPGNNPREMAQKMLNRAMSYGKNSDDMSVLAIGIYQKAC